MRLYQKIGRRTHPCRHCPQIASFFPSHCLTVTLFWISQEVEQLTQRWSVLGPENSPTEQGEQGGHIVTSLDSIYSKKSFWAIVKLVVVMILFFFFSYILGPCLALTYLWNAETISLRTRTFYTVTVVITFYTYFAFDLSTFYIDVGNQVQEKPKR